MKRDFDLIVIGGGIGGVICLHYAKQAGLKAILLEKNDQVGGLWASLPAWQDIQQTRFDWTVGDLPINGEDQRSIRSNIQSWVDRFELASSVSLNSPVTNARRTEQGWEVTTLKKTYVCKSLVAASGVQNKPVIPNPTKTASTTIQEYHSSTLQEPSRLKNKHVLVVGGGASAFDLLELSIEQNAKEIHWAYRSPRWMAPTKKPKRISGAIRWLGVQQMNGASIGDLNRTVNVDLQSRYRGFNLSDILPKDSFDFAHHQLIPGRYRMIDQFDRIKRYRADVIQLHDQFVELSSGESIRVDTLLWGTGYDMDLTYFEANEIASIRSVQELAPRCGSGILSLDFSDLYFMTPTTVGGIGSLPWAYAHASIAIMRHIQGKSRLGSEPVLANLNYFDFVRFLASMDTDYYAAENWPEHYLALASKLSDNPKFSLPIPSFR